MEIARSEAADRAESDAEAGAGPYTGEMPAVTPPPDAFPEPGQTPRQALDGAVVQQVKQVSLGTGMTLVGLGLGFLGFRMRRTN